MARLLVVDDEPSICWGLARLAEGLGHEVRSAASAEEALALAQREAFQAVVLDVRLPGMDGLSAMQHLRKHVGEAPIVIITAYGDLATAVEAVRCGAFEYVVKPFDLETAQRVIERALAGRRTDQSVNLPRSSPNADGLVGHSAAMQEVFKHIALVSGSDACVHLFGESGTGKELVARAIHRYSRRAAGPFIAINLASLSESLAESELFGHARSAFTGATEARRGLLEQADGGTIFLDEVSDIPAALQVKLLRSLEYGEVVPVGSNTPVHTNFRVISATHQNLSERVAEGRFRHDLFYRLNTFQIQLPSLRERPEDILELSAHFLDHVSTRSGVPRPEISKAALTELARRPWHGNVRELRNTIERALILARGGPILVEHLPPPLAASGSESSTADKLQDALRDWARSQWPTSGEASGVYDRLLELVEPPVLEVALNQHQGQCAAAARSLGLHRITLRKKLRQFGLDEPR